MRLSALPNGDLAPLTSPHLRTTCWQLSFFLGSKRSATVRASCWSSVVHIDRKDVDALLAEPSNANEKEHLQRLVEKMAASYYMPQDPRSRCYSPATPSLLTRMKTSTIERIATRRKRLGYRFKRFWRKSVVSMDSAVCTWHQPPARAFKLPSSPHPSDWNSATNAGFQIPRHPFCCAPPIAMTQKLVIGPRTAPMRDVSTEQPKSSKTW